MSAAMQPSTQWARLAPEGLGHELLTAWAPWAREDRDRQLYPAWADGPRVDRGYHGDPPDAVNKTDKIVAKIRLEFPRYYQVINHVYLGEKSYSQAALDLRVTQGWLRTMVLAACGLVEMRYRENE